MSSLAKAALLSAVVFAGITLAFLFMPARKTPVTVETPEDGKTDMPKVEAPSEEEKPAATAPLKVIPKGAVKLTVEVREKGRAPRLKSSQVTVYKAADGERPGSVAWQSERSAAGLFEITTLLPGKYLVHAQCSRFKGERRELTLLEGAPQSLLFELERGNSISGRVLTSSGDPIAGARVTALVELSRPDADLEEKLIEFINIQNVTNKASADDISKADGSYQLDGLELKFYTVRAVASGYAPGKLEQIPAPRDRVDIKLEQGGNIGGTVVDTSGKPVAGASVHAYPELESNDVFAIIYSKARPPMDTAKTDASGVFRFETLGAGLYNFLVQAKGYQDEPFTKRRVEDGSNQLAFTLKPGLIIRGIVRGPEDEPISGAKVRATATGVQSGRQTPINITFDDGSITTNDQGLFEFNTLAEGKYILLCWHDDYETLQRKDVQPTSSGDELTLKLSAGGRVRGRIVDASTGNGVAGAGISCTDVADVPKATVSQEDGTFVLSGLKLSGRPTMFVTVTAKGYARQRREVRPQESAELEENFELQPTGQVSGIVLNTNNDPISNARVMVKRSQENASVDQTIGSDVTDEEGRFTLGEIEAGGNTWIVAKKSEYLESASDLFAVESGQKLDLPPLVLRQGGSIVGKVLGPEGQPVPGCLVSILREGDTELVGKVNPSGSTNDHGEYIIPGLQGGTVSLVCKPVHFLEKRIDGVQVQEGVRITVNLQLEKGNTLGGRVVDGRGSPVQGAEVLVRDYSLGLKELRVYSQDDGRFFVEGISAKDTVELSVNHDDYGNYSNQKVPVGTSDLEIQLKGLAVLKGTVVTPDGSAVESFSLQPQLGGAGTSVRKQLRAESYNATGGQFEYKGLQAGVYTIQIRAPGFATTTLNDVQVGGGEIVDLGTVELSLGGIVTGTVVDAATGRVIPGARVQIVQGAGRFVKPDASGLAGGQNTANPIQITDSSGSFTYTNLRGGALTLRVSHEQYVSREVPNVNPDIAVESQGLRIPLETGGEVFGSVVDRSGKARGDMPVYLIGPSATSNQTVKTDRNGRFRFRAVPSGSYTVKAHRFGVPGESTTEQGEAAVELAPGASQEVNLAID